MLAIMWEKIENYFPVFFTNSLTILLGVLAWYYQQSSISEDNAIRVRKQLIKQSDNFVNHFLCEKFYLKQTESTYTYYELVKIEAENPKGYLLLSAKEDYLLAFRLVVQDVSELSDEEITLVHKYIMQINLIIESANYTRELADELVKMNSTNSNYNKVLLRYQTLAIGFKKFIEGFVELNKEIKQSIKVDLRGYQHVSTCRPDEKKGLVM